MLERGLEALRWLTELQISEKGHFRSIGTNGFYRRGGTRANFDQQPIEAQAMVSACLEAYRTTSDFWWYEQAQRAFDWFIGWNDLGLELYSPTTGGCRLIDFAFPPSAGRLSGSVTRGGFLLIALFANSFGVSQALAYASVRRWNLSAKFYCGLAACSAL